jgi:feruloyl esterase
LDDRHAAGYQALWDRSHEQYGIVFGPDDPDLSAFRDRGGKTIIWHGLADQLITASGTIDYYTRAQQRMGGAKATSEFARLYLAPGVAHCAGGPGPQPTGVLDALVAWVEEGKAPETLTATRPAVSGAAARSRPLCQYPLIASYLGTGSTDEARNFVCRDK